MSASPRQRSTLRGKAAMSATELGDGGQFGVTAESAESWLHQHAYRTPASKEYEERNAEYALKAREELPVLSAVGEDLFLREVLPYQHFDEPLDEWRPDFYQKLIALPSVKQAKTVKELAETVIPLAFTDLGNKVEFKADRTPECMAPISETLEKGYASCTGLSILVANALRSVGVPARVAGIAEWNRDDGGNHNWVEVWTGDGWHFIDAAPQTKVTWDNAWFSNGLVQTSEADGIHGVYTPVWDSADADSNYTVTWRDDPVLMPAIQRTDFYTSIPSPEAPEKANSHTQLAAGDLHAKAKANSHVQVAAGKKHADTDCQKSTAPSLVLRAGALLACAIAGEIAQA